MAAKRKGCSTGEGTVVQLLGLSDSNSKIDDNNNSNNSSTTMLSQLPLTIPIGDVLNGI